MTTRPTVAKPSLNGSVAKPSNTVNGGPVQPPIAQPPPAGRNIFGQFAAGNQFGRGHAVHQKMADMHGDLVGSVSYEQLLELVDRLFEIARGNDLAAAIAAIRTLLAYLCGRPAPILTPDFAKRLESRAIQRQVEMLRAEAAKQQDRCNEFEVQLPKGSRP
jgi:hypothetical protein